MCEILICRDCILFEHKNHDYAFVHDVIDELKTKFDNNFQLIQSILNHGFKQVETLNIKVNHIKQLNQTRINELAKTIRQIIDDYEKTVIEQIEENTNGDKKQIAEYEKHLQNQQQNLNMRRALCETLKLTHNHTKFLQFKQELLGYINKACVDLDRLKLPIATNWDIDDFNKLKENILQFEHVNEATQHQSDDPSNKIQSKHYLSCEVSNDNINVVTDALRNNKPLTKLTIDGSEIEDDAFQQLAHALKFNETLTTLVLGKNDIEVEEVKQLADALKYNTTLNMLVLSTNNIGDDGAQFLSDALRHNNVLTTLGLSNNEIKAEGADHLGNALRENHVI
ncbi:unnamed protein product [Adineta steineri]|uniref:Uncharacterized protein n=1 Tax=Adineta steineri TaxID=433720 RepID=A0A816BHA6_9BILA|nr:unnamed protein product [Adineta steineri]CAF1607680.1 unnamed protein product [Adineta steineri]